MKEKLSKISVLRNMYRKFKKQDSVVLDTCTICKSDCIYCLHQHKHMVKPELMTIDTFKQILEILRKEEFKTIHLYQSGEPMINPAIYGMIKLCSGLNITVGTRLNCEVDFNKLADSFNNNGRIEFIVSVDSIYNPVLSSGINTKLVYSNLEKLSKISMSNVTYSFYSIVTKESEKNLENTRFMLYNLGFNNWYPASLAYYMWNQASLEDLSDIENIIPVEDKYKDRIDIKNGIVIDKFEYCKNMIPTLTTKGNVSICCHDMLHVTDLGNVIKEGSLRKILSSKGYKKTVEMVNKRELKICKGCN